MSSTDGEDKIESLTLENERLKQAYKYIHASRNNVDKELNEAYQELASLREQLKLERKAGLEIAIKRLQIEIESWLIASPRPVPGTTASFCIDTLNQAIRNIREIDMKSLPDGSLIEQLKQKEDENRELKDDYKDLVNSIQRLFQTLIARQYNNIGVWSNERQDYNHQLINELEELLKTHNTRKNLSA